MFTERWSLKKSSFIYFLSRYLNNYLPLHAGASSNTIKVYSDTFKLLFLFAREKYHLKPQKIDLIVVDKKFILEFLSWITKKRKCSDTTRNLRLSNIKAFFSYMQTEIPSIVLQSQNILQIPKKKTHQQVIEYLTLEGIRLILLQPDKQTYAGRRHLVLLSFMFATGARVQEIIDVTINDFKYNGSEFIRLVGKGKKARLVPLENNVIKLLEGYLQEEKNRRVFYNIDDPIFLNHSNNKLTRQGIAYIIKKYAAKARNVNAKIIPLKIHPHIFRHSRAMALLQAGVELIYIRDFLGHYSVTTTETYARINNEATKKALLKVSPSENSSETPIWEKDKDLLSFLKNLGT